MSTGDFPRGKEFNCPDCLLTNGHIDAVPQINFCASCGRVLYNLHTNTQYMSESLLSEYCKNTSELLDKEDS